MSELKPPKSLDPSKFKFYDEKEIKRWLSALPWNIAESDKHRAKCQENLDVAKHDLKVLKAGKHLEARNNSDYTSNDDRKAYVDQDSEVVAKEVEIIRLDGEQTVATIEFERLNNMFTAIRKLASMYVSSEENQRNAAKYGG